jgi:hypothetical protein
MVKILIVHESVSSSIVKDIVSFSFLGGAMCLSVYLNSNFWLVFTAMMFIVFTLVKARLSPSIVEVHDFETARVVINSWELFDKIKGMK